MSLEENIPQTHLKRTRSSIVLKQETHYELSSITVVDLEKNSYTNYITKPPRHPFAKLYCSAHVLIFLFSTNRFYFATLQLYEPFVRINDNSTIGSLRNQC